MKRTSLGRFIVVSVSKETWDLTVGETFSGCPNWSVVTTHGEENQFWLDAVNDGREAHVYSLTSEHVGVVTASVETTSGRHLIHAVAIASAATGAKGCPATPSIQTYYDASRQAKPRKNS